MVHEEDTFFCLNVAKTCEEPEDQVTDIFLTLRRGHFFSARFASLCFAAGRRIIMNFIMAK